MHNKIYILIILVFTAAACEQTVKPLSFTSESVTEGSLEECNDEPCPDIVINYDLVKGNDAVSEAINQAVKSSIIASLQNDDEIKQAETISEAMAYFVARFRNDLKAFPETSFEYEAQINLSKRFSNENLVSFELQSYQFTGGAHGYQSTSFLNFDSQTGEIIANKDLFTNLEAFKKVAEKKFREVENIGPNEQINATGFSFENDTFNLPDAIGFTDDDIILHYNQYDIASYADGPIEVKIPKKEVRSLLNF